jgi:hypothetical protein
MNELILKLKSINPNIRILLTVSPVPLTATATDQHVLSATVNSKSILRAVAGKLALQNNFVDYFPSYELISSHATRMNHFEDNLRSVKNESIKYVMDHFQYSIEKMSQIKQIKIKDDNIKKEEIDITCEDILLENWIAPNQNLANPEILLLGDSHMGMLSKAFSNLNMPHCGGGIMDGSAWVNNLIHLDEEELFVPLQNSISRKRWLDSFSVIKENINNSIVITNIGMQTHKSVHVLVEKYLTPNEIKVLNQKVFNEYFNKVNSKKIDILKKLLDLGARVLVVSDPPTREVNEEINKQINFWKFYDIESLKIFKAIGCEIFNADEYFKDFKYKELLYSNVIQSDGVRDWYHGSDYYYDELAKAIIIYKNKF